jgi:hypothetical protein
VEKCFGGQGGCHGCKSRVHGFEDGVHVKLLIAHQIIVIMNVDSGTKYTPLPMQDFPNTRLNVIEDVVHSKYTITKCILVHSRLH